MQEEYSASYWQYYPLYLPLDKPIQTYLEIESASEYRISVKSSKFIAFSFPVHHQEEIKEILSRVKKEHPSASHCCFAWILGFEVQSFKSSDDGEPSNSAGKPILRAIQSKGITNVLIVVIRYFGGSLLGVPGLIEAYGSAALGSLNQSTLKEHPVLIWYRVNCPFGFEHEIYTWCRIYKTDLRILENSREFSAEFGIPLQYKAAFQQGLQEIYPIQIEPIEKHS